MMKAKERKQKIVDLVSDLGNASIELMTKRFKVSEMTIYRDLHELEDKGYLKKTTGGAISIDSFLVHSESPFFKRIKSYNEEKKAIARKAIEHINEGDSIIIDAGSTSFVLVKEMLKVDLHNLTIFTNSLVSQLELMKNPNIEVISIGGTARPGSYSSVGTIAENALKYISVDKAFLTTKGISNEGDLFDPYMSEGRIKQLFVKKARKKILVTDSNKFGIMGLYRYANIADFDVVIMDSGLQKKHLKLLNGFDIDLKLVEVNHKKVMI